MKNEKKPLIEKPKHNEGIERLLINLFNFLAPIPAAECREFDEQIKPRNK